MLSGSSIYLHLASKNKNMLLDLISIKWTYLYIIMD